MSQARLEKSQEYMASGNSFSIFRFILFYIRFDLLSNFDCCRRLSVPTGSRITITGGTDRNILPEAAISCIQQIFPHKKFFLLIVFFALPKYILHYILNNKKDDNDDINKYMFCLRNDDGKRTSTI
jgi:hypothetical protein